jgi:CheY-like chemotaxis protein
VASIEPSIAGKRCLVVDDEALIALDIRQILELAGASAVVCAGTAQAALAALGGGRFDVAIIDVKLGQTPTSLSVATALTERGTPFVILTGVQNDDPRLSAFPRAPLVQKPYQAVALLEAVSQALRRG